MATEGVFKASMLKSGGVLLAVGRQCASIVLGQNIAIVFVGSAGEKLEFSISESLVTLIRHFFLPTPAFVGANGRLPHSL